MKKAKSKEEVNTKIHFASFMDLCHLKTSELAPQAFAAFTEQGSSASQMTAAKVMDVIARPPDCDGQAADAVSAYTQVNMEDAQKLRKIPKSECPDVWIRLPKHKWAKSWEYIDDPVVLLERNLFGHPLAGPLWERQFEKH